MKKNEAGRSNRKNPAKDVKFQAFGGGGILMVLTVMQARLNLDPGIPPFRRAGNRNGF